MLEWSRDSISDFLEVLNLDTHLMAIYGGMLANSHLRNYVMRNFMFQVPKLDKLLFAKDIRKVCPGVKAEDISFAKGFGGVRPQLVDKKQKKLLLGEGKIAPQGGSIIFNITPSPGGTTCLGNGLIDMRSICNKLGATINEKKLKEVLFEGECHVPLVNVA